MTIQRKYKTHENESIILEQGPPSSVDSGGC